MSAKVSDDVALEDPQGVLSAVTLFAMVHKAMLAARSPPRMRSADGVPDSQYP